MCTKRESVPALNARLRPQDAIEPLPPFPKTFPRKRTLILILDMRGKILIYKKGQWDGWTPHSFAAEARWDQ